MRDTAASSLPRTCIRLPWTPYIQLLSMAAARCDPQNILRVAHNTWVLLNFVSVLSPRGRSGSFFNAVYSAFFGRLPEGLRSL